MPNYDMIVIGAGCAGSSIGMLSARKGYRVLLLDKASFPRKIISTHLVKASGIQYLLKWGLLDEVLAQSKCPPIRNMTIDYGSFSLRGETPRCGDIDADYCPRREKLDQVLVDAAITSGAEVREGVVVERLLFEQDKVTGIQCRSRVGVISKEFGTIVIGADGLGSMVARQVSAPAYHEYPAQTCYYYTYWAELPIRDAEIYARESRFIAAFPTNDEQTCVLVGWPKCEFHIFKSDIERNYLASLRLAPGLWEKVAGARRTERYVGIANLPGLFRKPWGDGWALAGDAGFHQDPITTQGIATAFRDSERLVEAMDLAFNGHASFPSALLEYEKTRNKACKHVYDFTCQLAQLRALSQKTERLLMKLREDPAETNHFFEVISGVADARTFFAEGNICRILGLRGSSTHSEPRNATS